MEKNEEAEALGLLLNGKSTSIFKITRKAWQMSVIFKIL